MGRLPNRVIATSSPATASSTSLDKLSFALAIE
jgi:hypothetical protein